MSLMGMTSYKLIDFGMQVLFWTVCVSNSIQVISTFFSTILSVIAFSVGFKVNQSFWPAHTWRPPGLSKSFFKALMSFLPLWDPSPTARNFAAGTLWTGSLPLCETLTAVKVLSQFWGGHKFYHMKRWCAHFRLQKSPLRIQGERFHWNERLQIGDILLLRSTSWASSKAAQEDCSTSASRWRAKYRQTVGSLSLICWLIANYTPTSW